MVAGINICTVKPYIYERYCTKLVVPSHRDFMTMMSKLQPNANMKLKKLIQIIIQDSKMILTQV